jgi:hypothetical protein
MANQFKILYNFPSRSRPNQFIKTLDNLNETIKDKSSSWIYCKVDENDPTHEQYWNYFTDFLDRTKINCTFETINSKSKIDAINWGINEFESEHIHKDTDKTEFAWDVVISLADDMEFIVEGFDNLIRNVFDNHFPDLDGYPHFSDSVQDNTSVLDVKGKKYFNRFKNIYHPSYVSLWCDTEETAKARMLGKYVFIPKPQIFLHNHPNNNRAIANDELYQRNATFEEKDYENFCKRRAVNFDL